MFVETGQAFAWKNIEVFPCFITLVMKELQYMLLTHKYLEKSSVVQKLTGIPFIVALWTDP
jgi:hypothetical protein